MGLGNLDSGLQVLTLTHMDSSVGTAGVESAKQGQQGTLMFPPRLKSGADFSQPMFSELILLARQQSTFDLLCHTRTHNESPALRQATELLSSPVRDERHERRCQAPGSRVGTALANGITQGQAVTANQCIRLRPTPPPSSPSACAAHTPTVLMSHFGALK